MKTGPKPRPLAERFEESYIPITESGCWLWDKYIKPNGYATIWDHSTREKLYAHRVAYELYVGPIPKGLDIDHLCRMRSCVNPAHLEPVTRKENIRRSSIVGGWQRDITHCKRGHEFSGDNLYITPSTGKRVCRTCRRDRKRRLRNTKKILGDGNN